MPGKRRRHKQSGSVFAIEFEQSTTVPFVSQPWVRQKRRQKTKQNKTNKKPRRYLHSILPVRCLRISSEEAEMDKKDNSSTAEPANSATVTSPNNQRFEKATGISNEDLMVKLCFRHSRGTKFNNRTRVLGKTIRVMMFIQFNLR